MPERPLETQLYHHIRIESVPLQGLDITDQDLLRQFSHDHGFNSNQIFDNYGQEFTGFFGETYYSVIWQALCELLFLLNRPWRASQEGEWDGQAIRELWKGHKSGDYYLFYEDDGNLKYGWVLYTEILSLEDVASVDTVDVGLHNGRTVRRKDINSMIFRGEVNGGGSEDQVSVRPTETAQPDDIAPVDIPIAFPKWSDKIKEKFHRSDDKDMKGWDKSLDDWQTEVQIALSS